MNSVNALAPAAWIRPSSDDSHDQAYRFGVPFQYLSTREQARLLVARTDYRNGLRWTGDAAAPPKRRSTATRAA